MGEGRAYGPLEMMDDITEVSSTEGIERKNTIMVTRNIEARSRTVLSAVGGGVIGAIIMLVIGLAGGTTTSWTIGAGILIVLTAAGPFLFVGTTGDATQQVRWKRLMNLMRSRNVEGEVFYPNSDSAENITELERMEVELP